MFSGVALTEGDFTGWQSTWLYNGLQIGILNIAKNAKGHTILPIVNWKFQ